MDSDHVKLNDGVQLPDDVSDWPAIGDQIQCGLAASNFTIDMPGSAGCPNEVHNQALHAIGRQRRFWNQHRTRPPREPGRSPKGGIVSFFGKLFGRRTGVVSDPDKVPDAFKQLAPVLDEVGAEAIGCCPENWTNAVFTIACDGRRIDYSLKNHRGEPGRATITPRLAQLAEQLYSVMASNGDRWTKAELRYDQDGGGWKFKSSFSYD